MPTDFAARRRWRLIRRLIDYAFDFGGHMPPKSSPRYFRGRSRAGRMPPPRLRIPQHVTSRRFCHRRYGQGRVHDLSEPFMIEGGSGRRRRVKQTFDFDDEARSYRKCQPPSFAFASALMISSVLAASFDCLVDGAVVTSFDLAVQRLTVAIPSRLRYRAVEPRLAADVRDVAAISITRALSPRRGRLYGARQPSARLQVSSPWLGFEAMAMLKRFALVRRALQTMISRKGVDDIAAFSPAGASLATHRLRDYCFAHFSGPPPPTTFVDAAPAMQPLRYRGRAAARLSTAPVIPAFHACDGA